MPTVYTKRVSTDSSPLHSGPTKNNANKPEIRNPAVTNTGGLIISVSDIIKVNKKKRNKIVNNIKSIYATFSSSIDSLDSI